MKNLFFLLASLCLIFSINSCNDPFPESPSECSDWCDALEAADNANSTLFTSHGDCMSLCATCASPSESAGNQAVCLCNFYDTLIDAQGLDWEALGVKNKGQCIKLFKDTIEDDNIIINPT